MRATKWISFCIASLWGLVAATAAHSEWIDTQTAGIFEIQSEFELSSDESQALVDQLAALQADVQSHLNLEPQGLPVEISLFKSRTTYRGYLAKHVPEGMNRPALFVQGTDMGRVYVYRRWGFDVDLRHESTHAILHNALPYVPMWIDEGLAEYFEVEPGRRRAGSPHLSSLKRSIIFGWRPNLRQLETAEDLSDMGANEYREAWAWAHFMLHGPNEVRQVLSDYLYDIQQGEAAGVFSTRLTEAVPDAEIRLVEHLREWR